MSKLTTFIAALKTGETRTTKALERVARRRSGVVGGAVIAAVKQKNAFKAPLQDPIRQALKDTGLKDDFIKTCIDAWPNVQKEQARTKMVTAINKGHAVRFRWGLKSGPGYDAKFSYGPSSVTITALSPRSSLKISGGEIFVAPAKPKT